MISSPTTVRRCARVLLCAALAALSAACSEAPDARDGAAARAREIAEAPAQPAMSRDTAASTATTPATAPDPTAAGQANAGAEDAEGNAAEGATVGGDGSEIVLTPLSEADIEGAALAGELACSFSAGDAPPLLLAKGDVASTEPARGVVKVGDYVEPVAAPGGFDAMPGGAQFSGAGKTIRIALTGAATAGGESPPRPATLTYDRADGARRTWSGQWRCGP